MALSLVISVRQCCVLVPPNVTLPGPNLGINVPAHVLPLPSLTRLKLREWARAPMVPLWDSALPHSMVTPGGLTAPHPEGSVAWCRSPSYLPKEQVWGQDLLTLKQKNPSDHNKLHPLGTALHGCKHFHTYYSMGNSQLCKEEILISLPFTRWVN